MQAQYFADKTGIFNDFRLIKFKTLKKSSLFQIKTLFLPPNDEKNEEYLCKIAAAKCYTIFSGILYQ
jgi:hypothetical protein